MDGGLTMLWHDVTKEPIPQKDGQHILGRFKNLYDNPAWGYTFAVLSDGQYSSEFDYDSVRFEPDGTCYFSLVCTHWSYIDPTGLPE